MSEYKVIQDIEAEDKLFGPLSLRQFIYAVIVVVLGFAAFRLGMVNIFLVIPLLPPMLFFGLLAAPFGQNQSSEVWLLGKIRYIIFSKKRIWSQSGIEHLVTITAPKKEEVNYSDGLSKTEVKSRLKALAATMDTRGWIVKDISTNPYSSPSSNGGSSRLMQIQKTSQDDQTSVKPDEDVLDNSSSNPVAQNMSSMVAESEQEHRQQLLSRMRNIAAEQQLVETAAPAKPSTPTRSVKPVPRKTVKPPAMTKPTVSQPIPSPQPMTQPASTDILNDVSKRSNSSGEKLKKPDVSDTDGEVVVSLH